MVVKIEGVGAASKVMLVDQSSLAECAKGAPSPARRPGCKGVRSVWSTEPPIWSR